MEYVDPAGLEALVACRLIALDKRPGVCPIGVNWRVSEKTNRESCCSMHQNGYTSCHR